MWTTRYGTAVTVLAEAGEVMWAKMMSKSLYQQAGRLLLVLVDNDDVGEVPLDRPLDDLLKVDTLAWDELPGLDGAMSGGEDEGGN